MNRFLEIFLPRHPLFEMNFELNPDRFQFLTGCFEAHSLGAPDLVSRLNSQWVPAGYIPGVSLDSPGLFYFVPLVGRFLGSHVDDSFKIFFCLLAFLSAIAALWALGRAFQTWPARIAFGVFIFIAVRQIVRIGDIFSLQGYTVLAVIPILVSYKSRPFQRFWMIQAAMLGVGLILGYANLIRIHSATGVLLFVIFWLIFLEEFSWARRMVLGACLLSGLLFPQLQFKLLENRRDAFLSVHNPSFVLRPVRHPFWHPIYGALGYISNPYQPIFGDAAGDQAIKKIDPSVPMYSEKYEKIIRGLTLDILIQHPLFIFYQGLVKLNDMRGEITRCFLIGLILAFWLKPPFLEVLPFLVCAGFYCSNGIVVSPYDYYVIGMVVTGWIFTAWMVGGAFDQWIKNRDKEKGRMRVDF